MDSKKDNKSSMEPRSDDQSAGEKETLPLFTPTTAMTRNTQPALTRASLLFDNVQQIAYLKKKQAY